MSNLPAGWVFAPLEDIVTILDSARVPLNASEREKRVKGKAEAELFPYYGATGRAGVIDAFLFDEPLILLGEDGVPFLDPLRAKAYLVDGKCWVNNHAHVLRADEDVMDRKLLTAYLNVFNYRGRVTGTTRLKLTQEAMRSIPVPVPPRLEQERIADKLDDLLGRFDACRQRLDRVPGIIKVFRQSVLAGATTGELTKEWREERGVSSAWSDATLGTVGDVTGGITKNRGRTGATLRKPYLRVANVYANRLDLSVISEIATTPEEYERTCLRAGDVLVVEGNGSIDQIGRAAMWSGELDGCAHQNHIIRWRTRGTVVPKFALYWLLSPLGRASLVRLASSSAGLFTLSLSKVSSVPLQVPTLEEQNEVVRRVESLLAITAGLEQRVAQARSRLERAVLATLGKAFRGELVPHDPNDEPASVMLERLRAEQTPTLGEGKRAPSRLVSSRTTPPARPKEAPPKKRRAS